MISTLSQLRSSRRVLVVIGTLVGLGLAIVRLPGLVALAVPSAFGVLASLALVKYLIRWPDEEERDRVLRWTMIAFVAHLLFGLASTYLSSGLRFYLSADSFTYAERANGILQHWVSGHPFPVIPHGKEGFYYLLASLFWVFGSHMTAGLAVNAMFSAGLVPVMADITYRMFGKTAARYATVLVVVMPGLFLWTSQLLKEAPTLFLLAVAISCAVRLVERVSLGALTMVTAALVLLFTFRAWVALVVAGGILLGIVVGRGRLVSGIGTGLGTFSIIAALMVASGLGYQGYKVAVGSDLTQANLARKDLATSAATGYAPEADISTTGNAIAYLPHGIFNFVLGPFPWQIRSARQLPFVPDMLVWWLLLPSLWRGYRASKKLIGVQRFVMVLPALGTVLLLSLALGNFGTVVRERLQMFLIIVPLISLGLALRHERVHGVAEPAAEPQPVPAVVGALPNRV